MADNFTSLKAAAHEAIQDQFKDSVKAAMENYINNLISAPMAFDPKAVMTTALKNCQTGYDDCKSLAEQIFKDSA